MPKVKGMFVDHTFDPPMPRSDGRIPPVGEIADLFHLEWVRDGLYDYPTYIGRVEVINRTKTCITARLIYDDSPFAGEDYDLRLIRQRNYVFVKCTQKTEPEPLFRSADSRDMLPRMAKKVEEGGIDLNLGKKRFFDGQV